MAHAGVEKTLIVGPAWVGDMVMSHTLVQLIARTAPDGEIHMVAPPATAPIAERMAEVDQVHRVEFAHGEFGWSARRSAGKSLRLEGFTRAYVLPNSWKSALLVWFAGIPQRIGWHGEARYGLLNDRRILDKDRYGLMIERFMALADADGKLPDKPYPEPRLEADLSRVETLRKTLSLAEAGIALCPGAEFGPAKKWPAEHFAQVAQALCDSGHEVWLMGSPNDAEDAAKIEGLVPDVRNLTGRTSLTDAVDILSRATAAVCNDSGLMHVACALGVRTVGIFGSTSPEFTPPLGDKATVIATDIECRPCFERVCPLGHLRCLRDIHPDQVTERLIG